MAPAGFEPATSLQDPKSTPICEGLLAHDQPEIIPHIPPCSCVKITCSRTAGSNGVALRTKCKEEAASNSPAGICILHFPPSKCRTWFTNIFLFLQIRHMGHNSCHSPPLLYGMWVTVLAFPSLDVQQVGHKPFHLYPLISGT